MRLLGVLRLHRVFPRHGRNIGVAIFLADDPAGAGHGLGRHVDAVGPHVGDEADRLAVDLGALVEPLGELHGAGRREAELARRFLLQGRCRERRVRVSLGGLGLDADDRELGHIERRLEGLGLGARPDIETADLLAVGADQPGDKGRIRLGLQMGDERPIFAGNEFLDLQLAIADEAQGDRLDAAGRTSARQLAPEDRRQVEADQIVEGAAGEIGIDQRLVDRARRFHGLEHGRLRDGIEDDAFDRLVFQDLLALQDFQDVPGDRLALAIRIGRQDDAVGAFDGLGDIRQPLRRFGVDVPQHREIGVRVDGAVLRRQIAHMSERGINLITTTKIFVDGLGLRRRFDDDDIHSGVLDVKRPGIHRVALGCNAHASILRGDRPAVRGGTWGRGGT